MASMTTPMPDGETEPDPNDPVDKAQTEIDAVIASLREQADRLEAVSQVLEDEPEGSTPTAPW